jgi:phosphatidylserine/phosphatidylglycerophosphate/cardiolipin synthase-like enzyme
MRSLRALLLASLFAVTSCGSSASATPTPPGDDASGDPDTFADDGATDAPSTPGDSPTLLYVEPDDGEGPLLAAIQGAKSAVHVEAYILTDQPLIDALVAAKKAGREVKVVLEQNPYLAANINDPAYNALRAAGVTAIWVATKFQLTHTKTIVIDPGLPTGAAWIMSLNLSKTAFTSNRDYAAVDTDPSDVLEADAVIVSDGANVADARVGKRLVVSPEDSRPKLTAMIDGAKSTLDIEMEELSDTAIQGSLILAQNRGVRVRIVCPSSGVSTNTTDVLTTLKGRGVQIKKLGSPDMHAKAIVVDGARAYVGSVNLTSASMDQNREIGVITATPATLTRLSSTIAADFAKGTAF